MSPVPQVPSRTPAATSSPSSPPSAVSFPGIRAVVDGSDAIAWVEKHISEGACAYPITPTTNMGAMYAQAVADGFENLWGTRLTFLEPESEHSSASASEGFAAAGGRVTNFTSGQGLVLMKEVLYTISGKRLPAVFHIGARALTSQALNVHAGHDDVMAVADTGWGILFAGNVQQAADLALIARRVAENSHTPFMCCQDGFLTTHTLETVQLPEPELMKDFVGDPSTRVPRLVDPSQPVMSGVVQNQDAYMKGKIAQRFFTNRIDGFIREAMDTYAQATGRRLAPVMTHGIEDAEVAIVAMGSMVETAMATAEWLRKETELRVGVVQIVALRPFPAADVVKALENVAAVAVVERMDDPLAQSNPLALEVKASFADALSGRPGLPRISRMPRIHSGIAGLGSRDVRPGHFIAVAKALYENGPFLFALGIDHELALPVTLDPDVRPDGAFSMRGYSVGGFGSVTTNKVIAAVTADLFGLYLQAYPFYGSEKKGLPTRYYLTAADRPIRTHCELQEVDFVPLSSLSALQLGDPLTGVAEGGAVFVQTELTDPREIWAQVQPYARRAIRDRGLRLYYIDAAGIAAEVATRADLRVRMQGIILLGVFLRVTPFAQDRDMDEGQLFESIENSIRKYFGRRGEDVVRDNMTCVRRGYEQVKQLPTDVMEETREQRREALDGRTVGELMSHGVITCQPDTPLPEVQDLLEEKAISCVVVVDETGEMVGLLSTTDLHHAQAMSERLHRDLPELLPKHLMTKDVLTAWPEESMDKAAERLAVNRVWRLVVTSPENRKQPLGILSVTDLARANELFGATTN